MIVDFPPLRWFFQQDIPMNLVNDHMVSVIKLARSKGIKCHIISSYFKINQGRISDVTKGRIGKGVEMAKSLPVDFPVEH
ncbi:unnamed protein product [Bartonella apihabitans]